MLNTLRIDPTRTTMLRRAFVVEMHRRFRKIIQLIYQLIVEEDALGLVEAKPILMAKEEEQSKNQLISNARQIWRFNTSAQKLKLFKSWLQQQIDANLLTPVGGIAGKPWTAPYVESAYKKALVKGYTDVHPELTVRSRFYQGTKEQFLLSAFNQPEAMGKLELLNTRVFEELKGVTATMSQQMGRILSDGLVRGSSPLSIAKQMSRSIGAIDRGRAAVIARTEIIHTHAEGMLDAFEALGIEKVKGMAEWLTAGDDAVCEECESMEGTVMTIDEARGLIPRHPNCRCTWTPADEDRKEEGQKWGKVAVKSAVEESIGEGKSTWAGQELL